MGPLAIVSESEATDKIELTYSRIKELLGVDSVPQPFLLYARVPAFLQDFFMNSKRFVFTDGKLTAKTKGLLALAVAATQRCEPWSDWLTGHCHRLGWSEQETVDALAVAGTCTMYNTFSNSAISPIEKYSTECLSGSESHTFAGTSLDEQTIELINVAISDLQSCHACVSGHVAKLESIGVSDESVLEAIQCAATMMSGIVFLNAAGH